MSNLASQQQLLGDLCILWESDALSLTEKAQEINKLRKEVERLAGKIEVLHGVVEEGLNERHQGRTWRGSKWAKSFSLVQSSYSVPLSMEENSGDESQLSIESCTSACPHWQVQDPNPNTKPDDGVETNLPFPKISSECKECLFFSAPCHNTTLCRMCKVTTTHMAMALTETTMKLWMLATRIKTKVLIMALNCNPSPTTHVRVSVPSDVPTWSRRFLRGWIGMVAHWDQVMFPSNCACSGYWWAQGQLYSLQGVWQSLWLSDLAPSWIP